MCLCMIPIGTCLQAGYVGVRRVLQVLAYFYLGMHARLTQGLESGPRARATRGPGLPGRVFVYVWNWQKMPAGLPSHGKDGL